MNKLLQFGIPLNDALQICKEIRECNHKYFEVCCNCCEKIAGNHMTRFRKYDCPKCKQAYCGQCCSSMYYEKDYEPERCHAINRHCGNCGMINCVESQE